MNGLSSTERRSSERLDCIIDMKRIPWINPVDLPS